MVVPIQQSDAPPKITSLLVRLMVASPPRAVCDLLAAQLPQLPRL
jgi:hypothetical protein